MPIREYTAVKASASCKQCKDGFEHIETMDAEPIAACPKCGNAVRRQISAPRIGGSETGFDQRAKNAGFTKFDKLGKGEYEKKY